MSIFVIGDQDTILGFALVGIEGQAVQSEEEARTTLDEVLEQSDREILLITRPWAARMQPRLNRLKTTSLSPIIVEIPGSQQEAAGQSLREAIEETVGMTLGTT